MLENGPFIGDFPIKTSICGGFSSAMFKYQRVYVVYPHFVAIFLGHLRKIMTNFGGKMTIMQCHAGAGFFQTGWVPVNLGRENKSPYDMTLPWWNWQSLEKMHIDSGIP